MFSLTAWVALAAMWAGAGLMDRWIGDAPAVAQAATAAPLGLRAAGGQP